MKDFTFDYIRMCEDNFKVKCNHCKFIIQYTLMSLTAMRYHMEQHHPEKAKWLEEKKK